MPAIRLGPWPWIRSVLLLMPSNLLRPFSDRYQTVVHPCVAAQGAALEVVCKLYAVSPEAATTRDSRHLRPDQHACHARGLVARPLLIQQCMAPGRAVGRAPKISRQGREADAAAEAGGAAVNWEEDVVALLTGVLFGEALVRKYKTQEAIDCYSKAVAVGGHLVPVSEATGRAGRQSRRPHVLPLLLPLPSHRLWLTSPPRPQGLSRRLGELHQLDEVKRAPALCPTHRGPGAARPRCRGGPAASGLALQSSSR